MNNLSNAIDLAEKRVADSKLDLLYEYHSARDRIKDVATSPVTIGTAVAGAAAVGYMAWKKKTRPGINVRDKSSKPSLSAMDSAQKVMNLVNMAMPVLSTLGVMKAAQPEPERDITPRHEPLSISGPSGEKATLEAAGAGKADLYPPSASVTQAQAKAKADPYADSYSGSLVSKSWNMVKEAVSNWSDDYAPSMGAALSYYTLFSLAPMLLIVIAVAGLIFGQDAARGEIVGQLGGLMGQDSARTIEGLLQSVSVKGQGIIATVIGVITLVIGATAVFAELQSSLDRIWHVPAAKKPSGIWGMIRTRILSFGMLLGLGFLLLVSLVVSAGLAALGKWWGGWFGSWEVLLHILNFVVSFAVVTGLFAMIYKFMPSVKISWHDVWIGAGVTALLFTIGKFAIGLYIGKSGMASGFGAAGSLVILLAWVYYSAQIFLLGAEFTWVFTHRFGSRKGQPLMSAPETPTQSSDPVPAKGMRPAHA